MLHINDAISLARQPQGGYTTQAAHIHSKIDTTDDVFLCCCQNSAMLMIATGVVFVAVII